MALTEQIDNYPGFDDACFYLTFVFKNLLIGVRSFFAAWHQFWIILLILD